MRPYTLVAELSHRCPLACPYCSNPEALVRADDELSTHEWMRVLDEAEALGVVQVHLSGGEPLVRKDLEAIAAHARALGLCTNLVTSGVPLDRERLARLADAGIDHVQLSLQDADEASADAVAGYAAHAHKLEVARWVKALGLPLTINVVVHRANIDRVGAMIALAEALGAERLELANAQYQGWAAKSRDALLPTGAQIDRANEIARAAKARLAGSIDVLFVKPDFFGRFPRACMDGWGRRFLVVDPRGRALPCHTASSIPTLSFESVREQPLAWIWHESPSFRAFRGEAWMPEPCKSCDRRAIDFGGCRCQAFAIAGDAAATDPACALSPHHARIEAARRDAEDDRPRRFVHRGR